MRLNGVVPVPIYRGPFGRAQAERLLWRAGFGPRAGDADKLVKLGLKHAVYTMTRPVPYQLVGPDPHDERNRALAPADAVGHDHLSWLDRMVRCPSTAVPSGPRRPSGCCGARASGRAPARPGRSRATACAAPSCH